MSVIPKFDPAFWYSGFDRHHFAELLPAQTDFWFISIFGGKYLVCSEISVPESKILSILQTYKFKFDQATWQYEKSKPFSNNPFLALAPPSVAIAICQSQNQTLPQSLKSSSIKVFEKRQSLKKSSGYIYFIVTDDYLYLKIGFSKNPSSRLAELQASRPQSLVYLGSFRSTSERFENICAKFEHLLVRNGWYSFIPELQESVGNLISQD